MRQNTKRDRRKSSAAALQLAANDQFAALPEGRQKKTWTMHDMVRSVRAGSATKARAYSAALQHGKSLALLGQAGTGKTFTAVHVAFQLLLRPDSMYKRVVIARPPIQGADIGALPGTEEEKLRPYTAPFRDILAYLFGRQSTFDDMIAAGLLVFDGMAHMRGRTFDDAIIILDEVQNCSFQQIDTAVTRLGRGSRVILVGDDKRQVDLGRRHGMESGIDTLRLVLAYLPGIETLHFGPEDNMRDDLVRAWLDACERVHDDNKLKRAHTNAAERQEYSGQDAETGSAGTPVPCAVLRSPEHVGI